MYYIDYGKYTTNIQVLNLVGIFISLKTKDIVTSKNKPYTKYKLSTTLHVC
jgi:hypothetical protein